MSGGNDERKHIKSVTYRNGWFRNKYACELLSLPPNRIDVLDKALMRAVVLTSRQI
jgi:hypothetical protein